MILMAANAISANLKAKDLKGRVVELEKSAEEHATKKCSDIGGAWKEEQGWDKECTYIDENNKSQTAETTNLIRTTKKCMKLFLPN